MGHRSYRLGFVLIAFSAMMGCKAPQSVIATVSESKSKIDSVSYRTKEKTDSSSHQETVTERILEGSTVDSGGYTRSQIDSLMMALASLPKGTPKIIYQTDPKMQTTLAIVLDSIGQLHFRCTTAERMYFERSVKDKQYITLIQNELSKVVTENSTLKAELKEAHKSFWEKMEDALHSLLLKVCLIIIGVGIVVLLGKWIFTKIRSFLPNRL